MLHGLESKLRAPLWSLKVSGRQEGFFAACVLTGEHLRIIRFVNGH